MYVELVGCCLTVMGEGRGRGAGGGGGLMPIVNPPGSCLKSLGEGVEGGRRIRKEWKQEVGWGLRGGGRQ